MIAPTAEPRGCVGESPRTFDEFEREGWGEANVVAAYHERFGALTSQSIEPMLDAAGVGKGTRVVDVASGPGYVAAAAARRGAIATGVDFSDEQIALARRLNPGIEFRQGDARDLPLEDEQFDAVVSNYGMPHFPDADAFLREAQRVLRPGGRIAFATWAKPEEARAFGIVIDAVREHGEAPASIPAGPNFFRFSDPDECERSLLAAGFEDVTCTLVPQTWRLSSADDLIDAMAEGTVRTAALLRSQPRETLERIRAAAREAVRPYERYGLIELPTAAMLSSASKR